MQKKQKVPTTTPTRHKASRITQPKLMPPCELASPEQVSAGEQVQAGHSTFRSVNHDEVQPSANKAAADARDLGISMDDI